MVELEGFPFPVLVSEGARAQGEAIVERTERADRWLSAALGFRPEFRLVVASADDWDAHAEFPAYGMPHTAGAERLVVGTEPASFFTDVAELFVPHVGEAAARDLHAAYGEPLDLRSFVDLIAVHELAHLHPEQVPFSFPRFWLGEFFANLAMVGYLAECEPAALTGVDAFAAAALGTAPTLFPVHALAEIEASLDAGPDNYVWFQMVLIDRARTLWDRAGADGLRRLYTEFREGRADGGPGIDDTALAARLRSVAPEAEAVVTGWPG